MEESEVKALMELIKGGVTKVTATEEKNMNMSVTLEHCLGTEENAKMDTLFL